MEVPIYIEESISSLKVQPAIRLYIPERPFLLKESWTNFRPVDINCKRNQFSIIILDLDMILTKFSRRHIVWLALPDLVIWTLETICDPVGFCFTNSTTLGFLLLISTNSYDKHFDGHVCFGFHFFAQILPICSFLIILFTSLLFIA